MTVLAIGTEKGGFLLDSEKSWQPTGPIFEGWSVTAFGRAPDGSHLVAVASNWFGATIHRSHDLEDWHEVSQPPRWKESSDRKLEKTWTFHSSSDRVYAGVAEAGLFFSHDGEQWVELEALNNHRTRPEWKPGFGGLCAHRILEADTSMWVGISAVGVFRSDDGGQSWDLKNDGIPPAGYPEDAPRPEVGYCVHGLAQDPADPQRIWRQDHMGVFRSGDGGDNWERIEDGLPSNFGFAMWRFPTSGRLFTIPLESSSNRLPVGGRLRVYTSDNDGDTWAVSGNGWPEEPQYTGVLRGAFDGMDSELFAFGTTSGSVWMTENHGATWRELATRFPRIGSLQFLG